MQINMQTTNLYDDSLSFILLIYTQMFNDIMIRNFNHLVQILIDRWQNHSGTQALSTALWLYTIYSYTVYTYKATKRYKRLCSGLHQPEEVGKLQNFVWNNLNSQKYNLKKTWGNVSIGNVSFWIFSFRISRICWGKKIIYRFHIFSKTISVVNN
jgi:hypothetical protein